MYFLSMQKCFLSTSVFSFPRTSINDYIHVHLKMKKDKTNCFSKDLRGFFNYISN